MSEFQEPVVVNNTGTPRWVALAVAIIAVLSVIGLAVGWSALSHANSLEQSTVASVKQTNDTLGLRLSKAEEQNQQLQSDLRVVTDKLNVTQSDLIAARKQTKSATVAYEKKLSGLQSSVQSELAAKASNDDVNKLNGDVTGVKGDLDATKNSIQMARSEMGTLIARNHDEIDQLRRMGQRDYFEFALTRKSRCAKSRQHPGRAERHQRKEEPLHGERAGGRQELRKEGSLGERADLLLHRRKPRGAGTGNQQGDQDRSDRLFELAQVGGTAARARRRRAASPAEFELCRKDQRARAGG